VRAPAVHRCRVGLLVRGVLHINQYKMFDANQCRVLHVNKDENHRRILDRMETNSIAQGCAS
jgi:hypothetical protein